MQRVIPLDTSSAKQNYEEMLTVKAAWYYYMENYTQQTISDLLGISRTKVVNLLEKARQSGVVQFSIRQDGCRRIKLEQELITRFGLSDVLTFPVGRTPAEADDSLAQAAAMYILHHLKDETFINMGYGGTTRRVLNRLAMMVEKPLNVVSLDRKSVV